jgi:sugar phosphate permease
MNSGFGNRRKSIIMLLIIDYFVMFVARSGMAICGPTLMKTYGWNTLQFGWISTAFFIGYAITMFPAGELSDKFGGGRLLMFGTLWWAVFSFLTPMGTTLGMMMLLRILVGIGQGVIIPANFSVLANWIPKGESGKSSGILQMGCPAGIALSMIAAATIIEHFGWKCVFYLYALLGPVWCIIWFISGSDHPAQDKKITDAELAYIRAGQITEESKSSKGTQSISLSRKEIFSTPSVWGCALCFFCTTYLFSLFMSWLPTYFALGKGIDLQQSATYTMIPYLAAIIAYPLGGILADQASRCFGENIGRKFCPIIGLLLAGIFLIIAMKTTSLHTAVLLIATSNFFLCLTMASHFSIPMIFSQQNTGTIVGMNELFGTFGSILSPIVSGFVINASGRYSDALYLGAGFAIVGAVILLAVKIQPIGSKLLPRPDVVYEQSK